MLGSQFCCCCRLGKGRAREARISLQPLRGLDEFERIGRRYQDLAQQRVRVERDWRHQIVELIGRQRFTGRWRLRRLPGSQSPSSATDGSAAQTTARIGKDDKYECFIFLILSSSADCPNRAWARAQLVHRTEPVLFRRSFRTASALPQRIGQFGDFAVPKDRDAVFIHRLPVHSRGVVVSPLGVLKSLPGVFLSGLVILLFVHLRSSAMSMSGTLVQLGGSLMILEMRSVVITLGHL